MDCRHTYVGALIMKRSCLLVPVFYRPPMLAYGRSHVSVGVDPLPDAVGINCKNGVNKREVKYNRMLLCCRFSGISESDLEDCSVTLRDVQAALLTRFNAKTILIGHSLESDLLALKVSDIPTSVSRAS